MSQVSYGTITITDTNDIESIVIEYNKNQSNQNPPSEGDSNWSTSRPAWQQGYYIWQRTRIHKSGTATTADIIGTPVCVTGSTGEQGQPGTAGRSLTGVETKYCIYGTGTPSDSYSGWQDTIPEYNSSTPNYWVKVTNTYSSAPTTEIVKYKDTGITNAMAKAADAQSRAATAETNASNALSLSQATQQHFWFNSVKTGNIEAGAYITDVVVDSFKPNKSGNYLLAGSNGIELGNGSHPYMQLTTSELKFFHPNSNTIDAQLGSNGLIVKSGGIEAGTVGQNGGIYLSTENYGTTHNNQAITINGHETTNWRQIIGTKFGVDSEGNLYANGAKIAGDITVSKLTVNSGATISDENGLISNSAIEVGGRNLLKLSDSLSTDNCWTVESGTIEDGIAKLNDVNNARIYQLPANGYWTWTANTVYTVSVEARTSATGAIHITPVDCGGIASETFTLSTEWKRYSYTFSSATVGTGSLSIYRNAGSVELRKPKLEIGNKATDWTPAPEDVNTNIALTAEGLDNGIGSLSERISGVELQQNSFEDEVDNKFTNIRGLQTAFEEDTLESLKNLKDAQSTFASISELSQLQKFINEYIGTDGYITSGGDAGNPYLEIGKKIGTTSFYVQISSTEMGFYQNGVKVAYINSSQLYITNSEVLNEQRIGAFNWKVEGSNRMSLVYSPK